MSDEHDEALIERVALEFRNYYRLGRGEPSVTDLGGFDDWLHQARRAIYPPKTRLQVARELWAAQYRSDKCPDTAHRISSGFYDDSKDMAAIIAALSLDKMED